MWLIAIDEAGYGPKLGPLVIAASVWHRDDIDLNQGQAMTSIDLAPDVRHFDPIAKAASVQDGMIRVDDSKQIFRSKSSGPHGGSLTTLHRIVSVTHHACGRPETSLSQRLPTLIEEDFSQVRKVPWLRALSSLKQLSRIVEDPLIAKVECAGAIEQWSACPWKPRNIHARMIDARSFNEFCQIQNPDGTSTRNKSDLLGESSIALAAEAMNKNLPPQDTLKSEGSECEGKESVQIFFDRHGGRRYYAGPIQAVFDEAPITVLSESARQSIYETKWGGRTVRMHFTVKGDRFVPVALSSLHAKYLREIAMASLNEYFRKRAEGVLDHFRPTAGYPLDADRFLECLAPLIESEQIAMQDLVRVR